MRNMMRAILAALGLGLIGAMDAGAATYTWDGEGGDNNWGTLNNWNPNLPGVADLTSADLVFHTTAGSTTVHGR